MPIYHLCMWDLVTLVYWPRGNQASLVILTTNLATGETSTMYTTANEPSIPRSLSLMSFISETNSQLQSQEIIYVQSSVERDSQSFVNVEDVEEKGLSDNDEEALSIINSTSTKRQRSFETSGVKHKKKQRQNKDDAQPKKEPSRKKDKGKKKMI